MSLSDELLAPARLAAVRRARLLDTGPEEPFDRLARLATTVLEVPLAFITVVDERRSFWKSCIGVDLTDLGDRQNTVEESFCQYVVGTRSAVIVDDAATDPRTRDNPSVASMGVRAWAGFPLLAPDGEVLGSFCAVDTTPRAWTDRDREVLGVLAAAAAGEVALRATAEAARDMARTLQASLLPASRPDVPGLDVSAFHHAGGSGTEVVGDFYDLFQAGPHAWTAVIGDVCGKGIGAATVTALARYTIRAASMTDPRPSTVLHTLNRALLEQQPDGSPFLTAAVAALRLSPEGVRMTVCSGGHSPPLIRRAHGAIEEVGGQGTLLGSFPEVHLHDAEATLGPGDALVLYTDGVTEAANGRLRFGERRLRALLEEPAHAAQELTDRIDAAVTAFGGGAHADDTAVLVLRVPLL